MNLSLKDIILVWGQRSSSVQKNTFLCYHGIYFYAIINSQHLNDIIKYDASCNAVLPKNLSFFFIASRVNKVCNCNVSTESSG